MVQMKEFRIVMPISVEEFQIAQMYMVMKMQQQNTTGEEGVEVLENRSFEDDVYGKGQYTSKIYRLQSKAPTWLAKFAPAGSLVMQEEAWNAYPRCKSVIKCPYFTRFILTIETIHTDDRGLSENVHGLTKDKLAVRQVEMLDIASCAKDYWSYVVGSSDSDFSQFVSSQTGRGPLLEGWKDQCVPVMTAYKLVTIDAPYWGFGSKLEQALLAGERALFLESHRNCFSWIDEWFGLTLDAMRELEKKSDSSLNEKLGRICVMAVSDKEESDGRICVMAVADEEELDGRTSVMAVADKEESDGRTAVMAVADEEETDGRTSVMAVEDEEETDGRTSVMAVADEEETDGRTSVMAVADEEESDGRTSVMAVADKEELNGITCVMTVSDKEESDDRTCVMAVADNEESDGRTSLMAVAEEESNGQTCVISVADKEESNGIIPRC